MMYLKVLDDTLIVPTKVYPLAKADLDYIFEDSLLGNDDLSILDTARHYIFQYHLGECGDAELMKLHSLCKQYLSKELYDIITFSMNHVLALNAYKRQDYEAVIRYLSTVIAKCPRINGIFLPGLGDSLIILSSSYAILQQYDDSLHSARLAVTIAHQYFESQQNQNQNEYYACGPILESPAAIVVAYNNLADQLESNGDFLQALEWRDKGLQLAVKFNLTMHIIHELQKLQVVSQSKFQNFYNNSSTYSSNDHNNFIVDNQQQLQVQPISDSNYSASSYMQSSPNHYNRSNSATITSLSNESKHTNGYASFIPTATNIVMEIKDAVRLNHADDDEEDVPPVSPLIYNNDDDDANMFNNDKYLQLYANFQSSVNSRYQIDKERIALQAARLDIAKQLNIEKLSLLQEKQVMQRSLEQQQKAFEMELAAVKNASIIAIMKVKEQASRSKVSAPSAATVAIADKNHDSSCDSINATSVQPLHYGYDEQLLLGPVRGSSIPRLLARLIPIRSASSSHSRSFSSKPSAAIRVDSDRDMIDFFNKTKTKLSKKKKAFNALRNRCLSSQAMLIQSLVRGYLSRKMHSAAYLLQLKTLQVRELELKEREHEANLTYGMLYRRATSEARRHQEEDMLLALKTVKIAERRSASLSSLRNSLSSHNSHLSDSTNIMDMDALPQIDINRRNVSNSTKKWLRAVTSEAISSLSDDVVGEHTGVSMQRSDGVGEHTGVLMQRSDGVGEHTGVLMQSSVKYDNTDQSNMFNDTSTNKTAAAVAVTATTMVPTSMMLTTPQQHISQYVAVGKLSKLFAAMFSNMVSLSIQKILVLANVQSCVEDIAVSIHAFIQKPHYDRVKYNKLLHRSVHKINELSLSAHSVLTAFNRSDDFMLELQLICISQFDESTCRSIVEQVIHNFVESSNNIYNCLCSLTVKKSQIHESMTQDTDAITHNDSIICWDLISANVITTFQQFMVSSLNGEGIDVDYDNNDSIDDCRRILSSHINDSLYTYDWKSYWNSNLASMELINIDYYAAIQREIELLLFVDDTSAYGSDHTISVDSELVGLIVSSLHRTTSKKMNSNKHGHK